MEYLIFAARGDGTIMHLGHTGNVKNIHEARRIAKKYATTYKNLFVVKSEDFARV